MAHEHETSRMSSWAPPAPTATPPPPPPPLAPAQLPIPGAPVPAPAPGPAWDAGSLEGGRMAAPPPVAAWGHGGRTPWTDNPRPRKKRHRRWPWVLLVLVIVGGAIGFVTSNRDDDPAEGAGTPPGEAEPAAEAPAPSGEVLGVGDTGSSSGLAVTLEGAVDPWTSESELEIIEPGNRFVAVEVTLTNTSDEATVFATSVGVELEDPSGERWGAAFAGFDLAALDGALAPGAERRGWAVFQVPDDVDGLVLKVRGSALASPVRFTLSP